MLKKSLATYEHGNNISRIEHNNKKNAKQYSCIKQEQKVMKGEKKKINKIK